MPTAPEALRRFLISLRLLETYYSFTDSTVTGILQVEMKLHNAGIVGTIKLDAIWFLPL